MITKKFFVINFIVLAFFISAVSVFAAGGGGGGGVPTCTQDQWDCTGWSQCSATGSQTRVCSLTYDCYGANDPKPVESQSCTPPVPIPTQIPTQTPTPTPEPVQQSAQCSKDAWTCTNWNSICDASGRDYRSCKISVDCPNIETPPPSSTRACQTVQCGNKATLRERISCRLNLTPAGLARDLELQYLPEACRVETGDEQKECIERYKSFQPCWNVKEGEERFSCVRSVLKLGPVVSNEVKLCQEKTGDEQAACKHDIKEKVVNMTIFRFYDLETRAEALVDRGADINTVADFETAIELKKQEFYKASTNTDRLRIILEVRKIWQDFINKVKNQITLNYEMPFRIKVCSFG